MPEAVIGAVVFCLFIGLPALVFSIPLLLIWTNHRRKMEELRVQRERGVGTDIQREFAAIRSELQALRDTSMQYDLSFENSLQRVDKRLDALERRNNAWSQPEEESLPRVTLGGRE